MCIPWSRPPCAEWSCRRKVVSPTKWSELSHNIQRVLAGRAAAALFHLYSIRRSRWIGFTEKMHRQDLLHCESACYSNQMTTYNERPANNGTLTDRLGFHRLYCAFQKNAAIKNSNLWESWKCYMLGIHNMKPFNKSLFNVRSNGIDSVLEEIHYILGIRLI